MKLLPVGKISSTHTGMTRVCEDEYTCHQGEINTALTTRQQEHGQRKVVTYLM